MEKMFVTSVVVVVAVVVAYFFLGKIRASPTVFAATTGPRRKKIEILGKVVLMKKNVLGFSDFDASVVDDIYELLQEKVSLQLISAIHGDPKGKLGNKAYLENWIETSLTAGHSAYDVTFDWEEDVGVPGAFLIRNCHDNEFFLKSLTLEDVPGQGRVHFVCNSWVYPAGKYKSDRIFFVNQTYLPDETPTPLLWYRRRELENLRGKRTGMLEEWDRIYDYAYYNDLGDADNPRPVLGGSAEYPYPRRGRTGRPPIKEDPATESRIPLIMGLNIYVPRDERFGHLKFSDFLGYALKSIFQVLLPEVEVLRGSMLDEFTSFEDTLELYQGGFKLPEVDLLDRLKESIPRELLDALFRTNVEELFKFPMPQVIEADETAWRSNDEFGREMLSGANPVSIRRLEYPYAGYSPNRPTVSRRLMPRPGTAEYEELKENPEKAFLKTITAQLQTLLGISLIEILSRHSSDEVYLGQRDTREWTTNEDALAAFGAFGKKLGEIEDEIVEMNNDRRLKNRVGPAKVPYTLLFPTSKGGLTGKGIPNSVSI